jgi:hypothetical protein
MRDRAVMTYIKTPYQHFSVATEENHGYPIFRSRLESLISRAGSRNANHYTSKYIYVLICVQSVNYRGHRQSKFH